MITMYTMDGKTLVLTHYCAMGNQPHMKLAASSETGAKLVFVGGANCHKGGAYMGGAEFTFVSPDHLQTRWSLLSGGKEIEHMTFDLTRAAGGG
jgi:hypothetical protein